MRIVRSRDCGNSPKNALLEKAAVALATRDARALAPLVADDVRWDFVGERVVEGREQLAAALAARHEGIARLVIHRVVSHGRAGCVNGTATRTNGEVVEFCDVYEFGNAKGATVRSITTYAVPHGRARAIARRRETSG